MRLPDPDRSRVVLIGSSEYEDSENLPSIPAVRNNLTDLHAVLTHPEHGIVTLDNCAVLLDETRLPAVGRALKDATSAAEDLLLVYAAGHGLVGSRHELYLAMFESDPDNPGFSSLPYDTLRNAVLDSRAPVKIVIIDSCFSGLALGPNHERRRRGGRRTARRRRDLRIDLGRAKPGRARPAGRGPYGVHRPAAPALCKTASPAGPSTSPSTTSTPTSSRR